MNHGNGVEGYRDDRRDGQGDRRASLGAAAFAGTASAARPNRGLPASRTSAVDAIAEDPAKLCLAGKLISWATAGNEVRFEKVAALQQAIDAGTYRVSSAQLAEKLMHGMRG
jgi:anti-sigma28 factor (negative regulator of flagellin synthesis)